MKCTDLGGGILEVLAQKVIKDMRKMFFSEDLIFVIIESAVN